MSKRTTAVGSIKKPKRHSKSHRATQPPDFDSWVSSGTRAQHALAKSRSRADGLAAARDFYASSSRSSDSMSGIDADSDAVVAAALQAQIDTIKTKGRVEDADVEAYIEQLGAAGGTANNSTDAEQQQQQQLQQQQQQQQQTDKALQLQKAQLLPITTPDNTKFTAGNGSKLPAAPVLTDDKLTIDFFKAFQTQLSDIKDEIGSGARIKRQKEEHVLAPPEPHRTVAFGLRSPMHGTPRHRAPAPPTTYYEVQHLVHSTSYLDMLLSAAPAGTTKEDIVRNAQRDPLYLGTLMDGLIKLSIHDAGDITVKAKDYQQRQPMQRRDTTAPPPPQDDVNNDYNGGIDSDHSDPPPRNSYYGHQYRNRDRQQWSHPRPPPPIMPKFSGYESESFERFEEDLKRYFQALGYQDDINHPMKPGIMVQALQGIPRDRFQDLSPEEQLDHASVMKRLKSKHGIHTKNMMSVLRQINKVTSANFTDLDKYAEEKHKQLRNADIKGREAVMYFINGLPADVQKTVNTWDPQTFQDAWDIAKRATATVSEQPHQSADISVFKDNSTGDKRVQFRDKSPYPRSNYNNNNGQSGPNQYPRDKSADRDNYRSNSNDRGYRNRSKSPGN